MCFLHPANNKSAHFQVLLSVPVSWMHSCSHIWNHMLAGARVTETFTCSIGISKMRKHSLNVLHWSPSVYAAINHLLFFFYSQICLLSSCSLKYGCASLGKLGLSSWCHFQDENLPLKPPECQTQNSAQNFLQIIFPAKAPIFLLLQLL